MNEAKHAQQQMQGRGFGPMRGGPGGPGPMMRGPGPRGGHMMRPGPYDRQRWDIICLVLCIKNLIILGWEAMEAVWEVWEEWVVWCRCSNNNWIELEFYSRKLKDTLCSRTRIVFIFVPFGSVIYNTSCHTAEWYLVLKQKSKITKWIPFRREYLKFIQ